QKKYQGEKNTKTFKLFSKKYNLGRRWRSFYIFRSSLGLILRGELHALFRHGHGVPFQTGGFPLFFLRFLLYRAFIGVFRRQYRTLGSS
ncbi:MAG: hypothetical protein LBT65_08910, partial [Synergistaceae bacterium]|nr:hypothetical protein [Synergistaceae bacterium]